MSTKQEYIEYAKQAAIKNGLDPKIFVAQINQESRFENLGTNAWGAQGIAQIVPKHHPSMAGKTRNPFVSLDYAADLMAKNVRKYDGDYRLALAAYNGGDGGARFLQKNPRYLTNPDKKQPINAWANQTADYQKRILSAAGASPVGAGIGAGVDPLDAMLKLGKRAFKQTSQTSESDPLDAMLKAGKSSLKLAPKQHPALKFATGVFNDALGGLYEGEMAVKDSVLGFANRKFGTNWKTDNQKRAADLNKNAADQYARDRAAAGETGTDWWNLAGQIAATAPTGLLGMGRTAGVKGAAIFAGKNAAVGTGLGASAYAENGQQRMRNAVTGGIVGAAAPAILNPIINKATSTIAARKINKQLLDNVPKVVKGILPDFHTYPAAVQQTLINDATKAIKQGKGISAEAIGAKATIEKAGLGLNATQEVLNKKTNTAAYSLQQNLMRQGKSKLPASVNAHNDNVILDSLSSKANGTDAYGAGKSWVTGAKKTLDKEQGLTSDLYKTARNNAGGDVAINHKRLGGKILTSLDADKLQRYVPAETKSYLRSVLKKPITLKDTETIIQALNDDFKTAARSSKGNAKRAIGKIRDALNREIDQSISDASSTLGAGAKQAFDTARKQAANTFKLQEDSAILRAVGKNKLNPDKVFKTKVLNGDVADLQKTISAMNKHSPETVVDLKKSLYQHLHRIATDDNGGFKSAAFSDEVTRLGKDRLYALFGKADADQIISTSNAAKALNAVPKSHGVNFSNSHNAAVANAAVDRLFNKLGGLGNLMRVGKNAVDDALVDMKYAKNVGSVATLEKMSGAEREMYQRFIDDGLTPAAATLKLNAFKRASIPVAVATTNNRE